MCFKKKVENKIKYFDLEEFLTSQTAREKSIENLPSFVVVERLKELAEFLDPLREEWGSAINVTSGFRNKALNDAVGGVEQSCHKLGWAADLQPANGKMEEFKIFVKNWIKDKNFDEAIIEKNSKGDEWIHIQLFSPKGFQRKKIFSLQVN